MLMVWITGVGWGGEGVSEGTVVGMHGLPLLPG